MPYIKEFLYYYKDFGPKYGWFWSFGYARFNALYFNRDGNWKHNTKGELNEVE
tara:strand:+ start:2013 stop:2171 length:159 start_codon:yes stop_codon:yes gene_type:complete